MKRFITLVAMLALVASLATFAGEQGKKMTAEEKLSWMTKELNLTADQQAKLKPILEDQQKQIEAVLQDSSLTDDAKKTKKAEIKGETNTQIKALLDTTQQEKFAASAKPAKEAAAK
jgi:Spy/CpxP family protein refolding chaperone